MATAFTKTSQFNVMNDSHIIIARCRRPGIGIAQSNSRSSNLPNTTNTIFYISTIFGRTAGWAAIRVW